MEPSISSTKTDPQHPSLKKLMTGLAAGHICRINSPENLVETLDIAGSCIGQALSLLFTEIDYDGHPGSNGAIAARLLAVCIFELSDCHDILEGSL